MGYQPSERAKSDAYKRGFEDRKKGIYDPPRGSGLADVIFGPIDFLAGSPSTTEVAEALGDYYRQGHSAAPNPKK